LDHAVELRNVDGGVGAVCRAILDLLPSWFGILDANDRYVETAEITRR
jgi:hypothetical protein